MPSFNLPGSIAALLLSFLTSDPVTPENAGPTAKPSAKESFEQVVATLDSPERYWIAPFVLADLESKTVFVWGEHAGMIPGDPLEFFVISEDSGHDYEALMVSYALPSDIHRALETIGLTAGGPVDTDQHRFWPRGDRVAASFVISRGPDLPPEELKAESFCIWRGAPMPEMPWVFTGSPMLPSRDDDTDMVYAADAFSPNSIASTFNLRATVFDLPLQGSKTGVYGDFILDPTWEFGEGRPMLLKLRPAPEGSFPEEVNVDLVISPQGITAANLEDADPGDLADVGAFVSDNPDKAYFLTLNFHDDLSLQEATPRAREVQLMEQVVKNLRVEPPPPGQVFYKSFVPDPRFRDRLKRPSQPIELHIGNESATAIDLKEIWGDSRTPTLEETQVELESPEDWVRYLTELNDRKSVLFVYAPPEMTLRQMRTWTSPVLDLFPVIFVYKTQE